MIDLSQVRIAVYAYAYWRIRLKEPHDHHRNKVQLAYAGKWPRSGRWRRSARLSITNEATASKRQAVTELSSIWRSIPKPVQRAAHDWLRRNPEPITCGHRYTELVVNKVIKMCHACYAHDDTRNRLIAQQAKRMMFTL